MDDAITPQKSQPIAGFGISGFRTLHEVEMVSRGPVTVICGPNNTGKSSLLQALQVYPVLVTAAVGARPPELPKDLISGSETAKIALDPLSKEFIDLLARQGKTVGPDVLGRAIYEELHGPIWLHFRVKRGASRVWELDQSATLTPLNELLNRWRQPGASRPPRFQSLAQMGGLSGGSELQPSWIAEVTRRCLPPPQVKLIPDVRRAADKPLASEDLWRLCRSSARQTDGTRIEDWATTLQLILQDVFDPDVQYEVRPQKESGDLRLRIDGEDDIPLDCVGAGVREVVAIAYAALSTQGVGVLAIEEPENCLHPMAVRRLVRALPERAQVQLFVSTHASAVVNSNPDAVIHLTRKGTTTTSRQVDGAQARYEAVRSLGYSPADLVLTPCAVWVEGPSDRLYLTRWLAAENLIEGVHYQVMFYGGALASHVTASPVTLPTPTLAAIRNLGRRCVLVADSDKDKPRARPKPHVQRFRDELEGDPHAYLLVTWGREIENYLPLETINEIRTRHRVRRLSENGYRYARIVSPQLSRRTTKIKFARDALDLLGETVPPAAKKDLRRVASFIQEAVIE